MSTETQPLTWETSSYCDTGGCVEAAKIPGGMAIRDNTHPEGGILQFSGEIWNEFMGDLKEDAFERSSQAAGSVALAHA